MNVAVGDRVRSRNDGQIGFVIQTDDGRIAVKLDRKAETIIRPYSETQWNRVDDPPLGPMQIGRISYGADRELRIARGDYQVPDWISLKEPARIEWAKNGPPVTQTERRKLFVTILNLFAGSK